jgi:PPK2 family polyphosphate:nucleotide phosphotransferase
MGRKGVLAGLDMDREMESREEYEEALKKVQERMLRIQQAYYHQRLRAVVVMEGWDAAGKGGAIRRLTEGLDPRGITVWPIAKPSADEQGRHYLYRFWQKLPSPGCISVFDRSWYGRVLVERVEGFAERDAWKRAYDEINAFERMLTDDGVRIIKLFLHITPDEQLLRFRERLTNPYKRWKITEEDIRNRLKWPEYEDAVEDMLRKTDTRSAPWKVVAANRKWFARVRVLQRITDHLADGVDISVPPLDPAVQASAAKRLGIHLDPPARQNRSSSRTKA